MPVRLTMLTTAALLVLGAAPARAQTAPTLEASPSSGLTAGQVVTVTGRGYAPGQGVYVQFCAEPDGALGTAGGRASRCNPDQAEEHTVWKTPVEPSGEWSVQLKVETTFEDVDCAVDTCGVFTRRDHLGGAEDFSQDAFAPVRFAAAAAAPQQSPTTASGAVTATTAAATASSTTSTSALAVTGSNATLALVGAACIGVGGAVLAVRRRAALRA